MKQLFMLALAQTILSGIVYSRSSTCSHLRLDQPATCSLRPSLFCEDIANLTVVHWLAQGTVKNVYLAEWQGYPVVLSNLTAEVFREDFDSNVAMHQALDYGGLTVPMLGHCGDAIVTEYHRRGNLLQAIATLEDRLEVRFPLCIRYAQILAFLHRHGRVMCDSNTLNKTLEQYVLSEDGRVLLNDLDALPSKIDGVVRCGRRMLDGDFVAPEQRGETGHRRGYDEKTDVFKLPDICSFLLGANEQSLWFRYWLFDLHRACKRENPRERPSAAGVLATYRKIWQDYKTDVVLDYDDL